MDIENFEMDNYDEAQLQSMKVILEQILLEQRKTNSLLLALLDALGDDDEDGVTTPTPTATRYLDGSVAASNSDGGSITHTHTPHTTRYSHTLSYPYPYHSVTVGGDE